LVRKIWRIIPIEIRKSLWAVVVWQAREKLVPAARVHRPPEVLQVTPITPRANCAPSGKSDRSGPA
jgi:hypothetical protein